MKKLSLFLIIFFIISIYHSQAKTIRYVKVDGTGDGSSWTNASNSIQTMIDNSTAGDEVWVAKGTYYPTTERIARDSRSKTFLVKSGINLYGGFGGSETALSQRVLSDLDNNGKIDSCELTNKTILSGDIDGIPDVWSKTTDSYGFWKWTIAGNQSNSYAIVSSSDIVDTSFLINGFTIYGGNANDAGGGISSYNSTVINCTVLNCSSGRHGGGVYCKTAINCNVRDCSANQSGGGGIYARSSVTNCSVSNCTARYGGGIYAPKVTSCVVSNCSVSAITNSDSNGGGILTSQALSCVVSNCSAMTNGGGVYISYTDTSFVANCAISNCFAYSNGGGINASSSIANCTVSNCSANSKGGGVYASSSNVINSIISNCSASTNGGINALAIINCAVSNNEADGVIESVVLGNNTIKPDITKAYIKPSSFIGNASTDVQNAELLTVDWHLKEGSSCINTGSSTSVSSPILSGKDLDGNPRVVLGTIDMGAYEYVIPIISLPSKEDFNNLFDWNSSNVFYNSARLNGSQNIKWNIANQKAFFSWQTNLTSSYSQPFFTYQVDASESTKVFLLYDMYFQAYAGSISPLGTEKLNVEYSTDFNTWSTITTYSNANGTIANQTYKHNLSTQLAGKKFFIRFNANGYNSNRIEKWEIDNVYIDANGTNASNLIQESKYKYFVNNGCVIIGDLEYGALVQLYDVNGKIINSKRNESESIQFTLPVQGVYIVKILNNSVVESKKIIW